MGRTLDLLLQLYGWLHWEPLMKMVRKPEDSKGRTMANEKRCNICGLWACEHIRAERLKSVNQSVPLGEQVGQPLGDAKANRIRVVAATTPSVNDNAAGKIPDTIPMGPSPEAMVKIPIPPTPKVPSVVGPSSPITNIADIEDAWVNCNICKARVFVKYLDEHQKVHINSHPVTTSRAITKADSNSTSSSIIHLPASTSTKQETKNIPKLSQLENYKFRPIEDACAASSMSQDGRYSDITVIFWMQGKTSVSSTHYVGGSTTSTYRDWERLSVHIVYDSLEEYFTVTTKLLKRSSYSSWDNEENIPDRICFNARELGEEIKRAFLFFCISPKSAYKRFRKLFKQELKIDYDSANRACIAQSKNCEELFGKMNKSSGSSSSEYGHHGYNGHEYGEY